MYDGKLEKSEWYHQMITHLKDYVPEPVLFSKDKKNSLRIDYILQENKPGEYLDAYMKRDDTQSRDPILYVVPNSDSYLNKSAFGFGGFEVNPYTVKGKFHWLCELMRNDRKSTIGGSQRDYAVKDELNRYTEWLSFLEQRLNPSFLSFLFPAYCDYMSEYTQLKQDNRSYCAP